MKVAATFPGGRLFWAIPVAGTPELEAAVADLERWKSILKMTSAHQRHLTVKFLGDTLPERTDQVIAAGRTVSSGHSMQPLRCQGIGVFPPRGHPNVIWAGLFNAEALIALAGRLDQAMCSLGFAPERRPFRPHLTLARVKGDASRPLLRWIDEHRSTEFGEIPLRELTLFHSELTPSGSVYTALVTVPLIAG